MLWLQAPFVAQAEPGVEDDPELYSDGEADYMETNAPAPIEAGVDISAAVPPAKVNAAGLQDTDKAVHAPKRAKTGGR